MNIKKANQLCDDLLNVYNELLNKQEQYGRLAYIEIKKEIWNEVTDKFNDVISQLKGEINKNKDE